MNIVEFRKKLEETVKKHNLLDISRILEKEFDIDKADDLEKSLKEIEKEERNLKVGIIGRVKAGKSSLLNALIFNGENILPKAATPMTASLVMMEYSDEISAEVEFFSKEDLEDVKREYEEYNRKLKEISEQKFQELKNNNKKNKSDEELKERALKSAKRELKEDEKLFSSYDQYLRIKNSKVNIDELNDLKVIKADSNKELNEKLVEFVGADGKYMPFTKSVTLKLKEEALKELQIIDTPGVNDPVTSREERTRELLKDCDAVFIVSPAGQFLSSEDIDLLDRVRNKQGISKIYVIASQVDLQLFGSEKEKSGGVLPNVLKNITSNLTNHLKSVFNSDEDLKENKDLKNLLDKEVLYTSSVSYSIMKKLDNKSFDSNESHIYKLLTTYYPEYFNNDKIAKENLKLLANIEKIREILEEIKLKKENILKAKKEEFLKAKEKSLIEYKNALIKEIENKIKTIKNSSLKDIEEKRNSLNKFLSNASFAVDDEYENLVEELEVNLRELLIEKLNLLFRGTREKTKEAEGTETETWEEEYTVDKGGGVLGWRNLFGTRYETRTRTHRETYTTVRTGFVRNALEDMIDNVEGIIEIEARKFLNDWKKRLIKKVTSTLRKNSGDENLEIAMINIAIKNVLSNLKYPEIEYTTTLPSSLRKTGTLKGSSAESFLDESFEFEEAFKQNLTSDVKNYINTLSNILKGKKVGEEVLKKYEDELKELENAINNKELELEKYENIKKELQNL